MPKNAKPKGKVVAASLSAGGGGAFGGGLLNGSVERAMGDATREALRNGITDPDKQLKVRLAARERVKAHTAAAALRNPDNRTKAIAKADEVYAKALKDAKGK